MVKQTTIFSYKKFSQVKSEHDLRLLVKDTYFADYRVSVEDARVDFLVSADKGGLNTETFLWAESKDKPADIFTMFAQLILTIKKKIDDGEMPPKYLGVFDREKIALTEYHNALDIFSLNDFDWKERPSSVSKKTINQVTKYLKNIVQFELEKDTLELMEFIRKNFIIGSVNSSKSQINKNNFVTVYIKWVREVLPSIALGGKDWKDLKKKGVGDCDFYLADLLSRDNKTIIEKLNILLRETCYQSRVRLDGVLDDLFRNIHFRDKGEAHAKFWAKYERPPKKEYHQHIIERRDLLVPQNIRERKGAFFTPQIWVEKSQEYLAQVFGENWQEEYYVWDCCAGTCNLLAGLTNKYNVWASTIDQPDVDIVHANIENNAFNLIKKHVFQFDFLNDDFSKLPKELRNIINDPEKQKKLIIYMNPPYAESGSRSTMTATGKNKSRVATETFVYKNFSAIAGNATRELFAQFFLRIYQEMPDAKLASFGKLKYVTSQNFIKFREFFKAKYQRGFVCSSSTFDNVKGDFPIGFLIWDMANKKAMKRVKTDVLAGNRDVTECWKHGKKNFYPVMKNGVMIDWLRHFYDKTSKAIGFLRVNGPDFANNQGVFFTSCPSENDLVKHFVINITEGNLNEMAIYFAVRHCIKATWVNDRDQFLYPNDGYQKDKAFQNDCLIFSLFHSQNRICSVDDVNHWLPFTAREADAKENFQSTLMSGFLKQRKTLSAEAKAVFNAGKALWRYYQQTIQLDDKAVVDASLYEIREYFKGRNDKGKMKTKSTDERFNELDSELRASLNLLAAKIQPKVFEYGFLRE